MFVVRAGELATPAPSAGILRGITRELVINLCSRGGLPVVERDIFVSELFEADELFLTSTLKGVLPIVRVGGHVVGSGRPGPLTTRTRQLFEAEIAAARAPNAG